MYEEAPGIVHVNLVKRRQEHEILSLERRKQEEDKKREASEKKSTRRPLAFRTGGVFVTPADAEQMDVEASALVKEKEQMETYKEKKKQSAAKDATLEIIDDFLSNAKKLLSEIPGLIANANLYINTSKERIKGNVLSGPLKTKEEREIAYQTSRISDLESTEAMLEKDIAAREKKREGLVNKANNTERRRAATTIRLNLPPADHHSS